MEQIQITARHLEIFLVLMTSTGLKEASEKLNCTIPAISKTIRLLEKYSQSNLFIKVKGRLKPTEKAEELIPFIQIALERMEIAKRELLNTSKEEIPKLKIGVAGGALPYLVPEAIRQCREKIPNLVVEMTTDSTQNLLHLISNHQIDLAVATPPPQDTNINILSLCEFNELMENSLVLVVPQDHFLAKYNLVRPNDLIGEPLITLYEKSPTVSLIKAAFRDIGLNLKISIQTNNSISVCYLVAAGAGIGLIHPEAIRKGAFPNLVKINFLPRISMKTFLYTSKVKINKEVTDLFISNLKQTCISSISSK